MSVIFSVMGFEQYNATVRWTVAHPRLDGDDTMIGSIKSQ